MPGIVLAGGRRSADAGQDHGYSGGNNEANQQNDEQYLGGTPASLGLQFDGLAIDPEAAGSSLSQDASADQQVKLSLMQVGWRLIRDGMAGIECPGIFEMLAHFSPRTGRGCSDCRSC